MNGFNLSYISQKTGIKEGKLKMILNRHPVLQELPYSVKNGGNRIFFEDFIVWLKEYEGVTKVTTGVTSVTSKKLPSGAQMRVMLDAVKAKVMTPVQFQEAIGVTIPGKAQAPVQQRLGFDEPGRVSTEQLARDLRSMIPARAGAGS